MTRANKGLSYAEERLILTVRKRKSDQRGILSDERDIKSLRDPNSKGWVALHQFPEFE
jgi:hypothetical protein